MLHRKSPDIETRGSKDLKVNLMKLKIEGGYRDNGEERNGQHGLMVPLCRNK